MVTRCLENHVFAATANRVGTEARDGRTVSFTGRSVVIGTKGELLVSGALASADCMTVEIDPAKADDKAIHHYDDTFGSRRPEFYDKRLGLE